MVRLCHRLDGLPLALELAAARVRLLSPAHMLERLGEGFDLLSADSRTALSRQQTLRATLDWSYGLLSDDERTLFRRLATFAGTFDVESCERVCAGGPVPAQAVLGLLAGLAEKSLLVVAPGEGGTRYRLLETIRDYAREALTRSGEAKDLREAHARWCQEVVGGPRGPDLAGRAAWSERLELVRDDLRLAFAWLLDQAPDEALALAAQVAEVMLVRGHVAEIRGWLQSGLAAAPARTGARATALMELCNVIARVGSNTECIELANESLSIAADLGDRSAMGRAMHGVGVFLWMVEDFGAARDMFERSLELAREDGNSAAGAVALHSLGALAWRCGRFDEAERRLAKCRELLDELGGGGDRHLLLINAGALGLRRAFDGGWWPVQEETAIPFLGTPPRLAPAMVLANLGALSRARGAYGQARDRLERSLAQLEALGDRATIAQVVARLGFVAADEGVPAEARHRLDRALELYRAAGDARGSGLTLGNLANLALAAGDVAGARVLVEESVALFRHTEDKPALMSQLLNLAYVEVTSGEAAAASRHLEEALSLISTLGAMPWLASWVRLRLAHLVAEGGDPWRARDLLNRALRCFEGAWDPRGLAACRRLLERLDAMTATS